MSETQELIARLRKKGWFVRHEGDGSWMMLSEPDPDCVKAADALSRMSAPVGELETTAEGRETVARGIANLSIVVPAHLREWFAKVINDADKAARLQAEVERLSGELSSANAAREAAEARLRRREAEIGMWLGENAPYCAVDQKHLDSGTQAQAYWHYGYLIAVRDFCALLTPELGDTK